MKKYFFPFLFLLFSMLGSTHTFGSGTDGGMVIDVEGKNGNTTLSFILPEQYITPDGSLVSTLSIKILNEKHQLIYLLDTNSFSITLPSSLKKGNYAVIIEIEDLWTKEFILL